MTYLQHIRRVLVLGLPLIGSHVAQMSIQLTDTIMLGRYDVTVLAGQVLAGTMFFILLIIGSGFAFAVTPLVAEADARGDSAPVRRATRMALWLTGAFGVICLPLMLAADPLLRALGQEPTLADLARQYLWIQSWSIFPALAVMVLKSTLAGVSRTQVVFWATVLAVIVNIACNYLLIFGNLGFPELGIRGAAIASLFSTLVSFAIIFVYSLRALADHRIFAKFWRPDGEALGQVFRLGWPIGITLLAEVGLFSASSVMMGWLGTIQLAAHGIALNIVSLIFMVHLGFANAATIRAGNAMGAGDGPLLRRGALVVTALSLSVAAAAIVLLLVWPETLVAGFLDRDDPDFSAVMTLGVSLLAAAALFQLVDAGQVLALGLLRGLQDTRVPMIHAVLSYWGVGLPAAYVLGFPMGYGGVGIWAGLAMGLAVAAVLMTARFLGRGAYSVERANGSSA
ncbi:MATE family efflux transporter [Palleronia sp. LCG004]|uniref:MATE family efflux transporter n=1 Tax=Palleronia sp. LCG004 TaxID=3079304 RepID=UPI0029421B4D|nr:MATE family efflux transporter [Palleronia sp. LCG004]WOI56768.1 MATE family efflux transporter [Palleronia sp. LCG004]